MYGINLDKPIEYQYASLRYFQPGEHHIRRFFDKDVLLLVCKGILRFSEDGKMYEIGPGTYHIQKHDSFQDGEEPSDSPEYLYVHFYAQWDDDVNCLTPDGTFEMSEFSELIARMDRAANNETHLTERCSIFYEILSKLYQQSMLQFPGTKAARDILNDLSYDLKNPPSLEDLSKKYHFSKNYIISLTKAYCQETPYHYLGRLRLMRAVDLLEASTLSLEEIADACGYSDYSHFYRAFRNQYHCAPGQWRHKIAQNMTFQNTSGQ